MVTIKIPKETIPSVVGALELGIRVEDWYAYLAYSATNQWDDTSDKWIRMIRAIQRDIQRQTKNEQMYFGHGAVKESEDVILQLVENQTEVYRKLWAKKEKKKDLTDKVTEVFNIKKNKNEKKK